MIKRILLYLAIPLLYCICPAISDDQTEIVSIKAFPPASEVSDVVFTTGFDLPQDTTRNFSSGFRLVNGEGRSGTTALFYERTDPNAYPLYSIPIKNLLPETSYMASVWVRGENLRATGNEKNIGVICVEYSQNGQWVGGGAYYSTDTIDADWQQVSVVFRTPPEVATGRQTDLKLYLRQKVVGKIWFDDVEVRSTVIPPAAVLTRPDRLSFFGDDGRFALRVEKTIPENSMIVASITNGGKSRYLLLKPDKLVFRGDAGKLEPGSVEIAVKIADVDKKVILSGETFHLEARPDTPPPMNACIIDEFGRAIVDGKPFMPLGVYGFADEANYRRLKDAGFNCLQLYNSLELKGNADRGDPIKNVREGLDLIDKHGLKLIFSLKDQFAHHPGTRKNWAGAEGIDAVSELAVQTVKDHPALLAWYISDEELRKDVPQIVALRRLISRLDPWHPTWTLTYRYEDLPYYGISGDVIGVDPYPISEKPVEQSIKHVKTAMTAGRTTGLPVWVVPQIFNWGVYRLNNDPKAFAESHFPTLDEMRTMALYAAMLGAKGFVFYSNFDVMQRYDRLLPGSGEREWPKVVEMVKSVKELEPFIMSTQPPLALDVESEPKGAGAVEAGVLLDDEGNFRVIVVGTGGKAEGIFAIPESIAQLTNEPLQSKYGKTKHLGGTRYEFLANSVDSDILE